MPALVFSVPTIVFLAGLAFAVGEWSRRPILVFVLPVAVVLVDGFFLWEWSPNWLDPRINRLLDVDRSLRVPLAERDLAQGRPRRELLQQRADPAGSRLSDQPRRLGGASGFWPWR